MDLHEAKRKIEAILPEITQKYHVAQIGVFGSFVTSLQTESSDIDILVVFREGHNDYFNYSRLKDYLEGSLGKEVDLVPKNAIRAELKDRILKEVVYA